MYAEDEKTEQYVIDTGSEIQLFGLGTVHYHDWVEIVMAAVCRTDLDGDVVKDVEQAVVDEFVDEDVAVIRDQDELLEVYRNGAEELAEKGRQFVAESGQAITNAPETVPVEDILDDGTEVMTEDASADQTPDMSGRKPDGYDHVRQTVDTATISIDCGTAW